MQHTPAPWRIEEGSSPLGDTGDYTSYRVVVSGQGPERRCIADLGDEGDEDEAANALLIAAAPDMLDLMKKHLRESGCDGDLCSRSWHEEFLKVIRSVEPDWSLR